MIDRLGLAPLHAWSPDLHGQAPAPVAALLSGALLSVAAYALLRVEERARAFATASVANVGLTIVLTIWLVVFADQGALGLVLGNYAASAVVLVGLWFSERHALGMPSPQQLRPNGGSR